jgi:hypothetical protein
MSRRRSFLRGQPVVYRKSKCSSRPGPRAIRVDPAPRGEQYAYQVDKYWRVAAVCDDATILLTTRTGKIHAVRRDDPNLRHATLWERWRYGARFPQFPRLEVVDSSEVSTFRPRYSPEAHWAPNQPR